MLSSPLQHYLNVGFRAAKLVEAHTSMLSLLPPGDIDPQLQAEVQTLRREAIEANLRLVSGSAAHATVRDYATLCRDFNAPAWVETRMTPAQKGLAAEKALLMAADT